MALAQRLDTERCTARLFVCIFIPFKKDTVQKVPFKKCQALTRTDLVTRSAWHFLKRADSIEMLEQKDLLDYDS